MKQSLIESKRQQWEDLEELLGYTFKQRNLLRNALCHRSFANENFSLEITDNERLEFLGDAVLDLVAARELLHAYPDHREGELTRMRAEMVAEPSLVEMATRLSLGDCLLLGRGEQMSGGAEKPSLLADTLEALFGAIFLDGGYAAAAEVVSRLIKPKIKQVARQAGQDYKSRLQELLQARQEGLPRYTLISADGPDHDRIYHVEVVTDDQVRARGKGRTKKKAEQSAARAALEALGLD